MALNRLGPAVLLSAVLVLGGCSKGADSEPASTSVPPPPKTATEQGNAPSPDKDGGNMGMPGGGPSSK